MRSYSARTRGPLQTSKTSYNTGTPVSELNKQRLHVDPVLPNHTLEEIKDLQIRVACLALKVGYEVPLEDELKAELQDIFHALGIGYRVEDRVEVVLSPGEAFFSGLQLSYLRNLLDVMDGQPTGHLQFLQLNEEAAGNSDTIVAAMEMLNEHMTAPHVTSTLDPEDPRATFLLPQLTRGTKLFVIAIGVDNSSSYDDVWDY